MSDQIKSLPWQRWSLNDLALLAPPVASSQTAMAEQATEEALEERKRTEADSQPSLQALYGQSEQQGWQQGFDKGKPEGFASGYQSGFTKGEQEGLVAAQQQQQPITERYQQLITEFQQTLDALDAVIASRLMQLALTASRQILGQSAIIDGTMLLNQIQQLIQHEPLLSGKPQLRVHPDDLALVEERLGSTLTAHGWILLADRQLHPGGCKISAEDGELDASLATRWHELCRLAAPGEV